MTRITSAAIGFLGGALAMAVLTMFAPVREAGPVPADAVDTPPMMAIRPAEPPAPPEVFRPPVLDPETMPVFHADAVESLRSRHLEMPVLGVSRGMLRESFNEKRGESRAHEALDILAPLGTPVVAVESGTIARLFLSVAGGITIYLFDPTTTYAYYYAHLDRYADGLTDGMAVKRGQVLGYVGASGNAPRETPHLHFAIFTLTDERKWWQGTPLNPYDVLR